MGLPLNLRLRLEHGPSRAALVCPAVRDGDATAREWGEAVWTDPHGFLTAAITRAARRPDRIGRDA